MWETISAIPGPLWAAFGAVAGAGLTSWLQWARFRHKDRADVASELAEASVAIITHMRQQVEWTHDQLTENWEALHKCRALCEFYELQLRQRQVEMVDDLNDDAEGIG